MRKFLSVLVAVTMCICLLVPAAFAANDESLEKLFEGVDVASLTDDELTSILGSLNLQDMDLESIRNSFGSGDSSKLKGLEDAVGSIGSGSASAFDLDGLSSLLGGEDMSWLTDVVSDPSGILDMFSGASGSGFDVNALIDMISGAFGGAGLDLGAITGGMGAGSFDIMSILGLGNGGAASGATDIVSTIMDGLKSGLEMLGLDPSMLDGILDNDIVNFFANLFIGAESGGSGSSGNSGSSESSDAPQTGDDSPATPNTGDTSAVFVAIGTISVAAAAAFVSLKKKD